MRKLDEKTANELVGILAPALKNRSRFFRRLLTINRVQKSPVFKPTPVDFATLIEQWAANACKSLVSLLRMGQRAPAPICCAEPEGDGIERLYSVVWLP